VTLEPLKLLKFFGVLKSRPTQVEKLDGQPAKPFGILGASETFEHGSFSPDCTDPSAADQASNIVMSPGRKPAPNGNIPAKVEWRDGVRQLNAVFSFRTSCGVSF
jgi:hypothetical protein